MARSIEQMQLKYEKTSKAINSLKNAIENLKKGHDQLSFLKESKTEIISILHDSMIQRFEYSFDLSWKYLKSYLENVLGLQFTPKGSKTVFRESLKAEILTDEEVRLALKMVDDRNSTTHIYSEKLAEEICNIIPEYYELLNKIITKTKI